MNLPSISVRRPMLTTMATLMVVVVGVVALGRIEIDLLPDIELPTVTVRTEYSGASPEVMERLVTQILEEIIGTVPGVLEIRSQSSQGNSIIEVTFGWGTEVDTAALDVQSKIEDEIDELPPEIERPRVQKFDIASFPVVLLGISSELDPVALTTLVEDQLRQRFARILDVAQVDVWGGYDREVRVEVDPSRVSALEIPLAEIVRSLQNANLDLPTGQIEQGRHNITLRAPEEFRSLDDIRNTVVVVRDGAPITIGQIATVEDTYERLTRAVRVNGERGIRLAIRKQANANTVDVSRRVLEEVRAINEAFPQISVVPVINQGNFIERSIANVARSVLYGGSLAVFILLFFLLSLRSTLVIAMAIPVSMIATFAVMYFGGLTINLTTLGGLALGVGMMVDSSIVVLENIFRRRDENAEDIRIASIEGAREVAPAIVASTITTLVVFLPLAFVRGVSGVLFQSLAYVISFSLLCSLIVSLTFLPVVTSKTLRGRDRDRDRDRDADRNRGRAGRMGFLATQAAENARAMFVRFVEAYRQLLIRALDRPKTVVAGACGLFLASLLLAPLIGTEFLPPSDEGEVRVRGEMEVGSRLSLVDRQTREMEKIVYAAVPEAIASVVTVGASGRRPEDAALGEIQLSLPPATERKRSSEDIANTLRAELAGQIPGMEIRVRAPQGNFLLERILGGEEGLRVEVRGFDLDTLDALALSASEAIRAVPGITDVDVTRDEGAPQEQIRVDRAKVASVGLTVRDVTQALGAAVAGAQAGEFRVGDNSYRILVQLAEVTDLTLDEILGLPLTTASGEPVAIRNVVSTEPTRGPTIIHRKNQERFLTIAANVSGRDLGSVARDVQARLEALERPPGFEFVLSGAFEEQQKAFNELTVSLALALLLVYMVLASQYESLTNPLVVMLSVPLAGIGVLSTLYATNTTLNVQSFIGCLMLGGIVVNNAILLVDQASALQKSGTSVRESVIEAGRRRLRPILMTTSTTVLGLFPLALGIGEGADAQAPLARAVIGGLVGSTPVTLILIPVVYMLLHRRRPEAPATGAPEHATP